nr:putative ribonuclease H-like domain-containing protein [Tanacetum cinerariifolium]
MFTTMSCDFLETKYFYSLQHSAQGGEQCDILSWIKYTSEESCPNQNITSAEAHEQSSPNISAIEDTVPNLISEVSNSQPSDSLDEIPKNIHETVGVQEHKEPILTEVEEPTLTEVPENMYFQQGQTKESLQSDTPQKKPPKFLKEAPSNVEQALKSEK